MNEYLFLFLLIINSERSTGRLSLVFELMEMNIYELIRGRRHYLAEKKVKLYMYQLLKAIDHMHRNGIFHRDIKPENIKSLLICYCLFSLLFSFFFLFPSIVSSYLIDFK